jgi:outer membrane cobalamin receptor
MKKIIIAVILLLQGSLVFAQQLTGHVFAIENNKEIPLAGASVFFPGTTTGTVTAEDGSFVLEKSHPALNKLVISYVGFVNDTVPAEGNQIKVVLQSTVTLKGVEVKASRPDTYISQIHPLKTEVLTTTELEKNACCNLSESFESNPTVDASYSDAVTGARQIQMLGLSGTYVQSLVDVLPVIRGLNTSFGFNFIPGPWVENIYVSKGNGSVVNGYESITGQIDVELKKPERTDKFFLNLYGNNEGRFETNVLQSFMLDSNWSTMYLLSGNVMQNKMDHNHDRFIDVPLNKQYQFMNRWKFDSGKRVQGMFGLRYLNDDRTAGDIRFNPKLDKLTTNYYGIGILNKRFEAFAKSSYAFKGSDYQSIGLQLSYIQHKTDAYYGLSRYDAKEQTFYSNLIYQSLIGDSRFKFRTGMSFMADTYHDHLDSLLLAREEIVPGAFFEFTYDDLHRWTIVPGIRADYNSEYDWFVNPRLHVRYKISENSSIRASAGSGHHTPHVLAEYTALPASSKQIIISDKLKAEHAWNTGLNYSLCFLVNGREAKFSIDAYRTVFLNQTVVDLYTESRTAYIYNLDGKSYSNSLQMEIMYEPVFNFKLKAAWKFNDVKTTYNGTLMEKPLNPKQRALFNAAYETPNGKWKADFTLQYTGKQKLPPFMDHSGHNHSIDEPATTESPDYFRSLGQVTYMSGNWDVYVGSENLGNYRQHNPVINPDDPFGKDFDTGIVWGPVSGRMFYAGIRFTIN